MLSATQPANVLSGLEGIANEAYFTGLFELETTTMRRTNRLKIRRSGRFLPVFSGPCFGSGCFRCTSTKARPSYNECLCGFQEASLSRSHEFFVIPRRNIRLAGSTAASSCGQNCSKSDRLMLAPARSALQQLERRSARYRSGTRVKESGAGGTF